MLAGFPQLGSGLTGAGGQIVDRFLLSHSFQGLGCFRVAAFPEGFHRCAADAEVGIVQRFQETLTGFFIAASGVAQGAEGGEAYTQELSRSLRVELGPQGTSSPETEPNGHC